MPVINLFILDILDNSHTLAVTNLIVPPVPQANYRRYVIAFDREQLQSIRVSGNVTPERLHNKQGFVAEIDASNKVHRVSRDTSLRLTIAGKWRDAKAHTPALVELLDLIRTTIPAQMKADA